MEDEVDTVCKLEVTENVFSQVPPPVINISEIDSVKITRAAEDSIINLALGYMKNNKTNYAALAIDDWMTDTFKLKG